jgi:hypothetical protein
MLMQGAIDLHIMPDPGHPGDTGRDSRRDAEVPMVRQRWWPVTLLLAPLLWVLDVIHAEHRRATREGE